MLGPFCRNPNLRRGAACMDAVGSRRRDSGRARLVTGPAEEKKMPKKNNKLSKRCPRCGHKIKKNNLVSHMAKEHEVLPDNKTCFNWKLYVNWINIGRPRFCKSYEDIANYRKKESYHI